MNDIVSFNNLIDGILDFRISILSTVSPYGCDSCCRKDRESHMLYGVDNTRLKYDQKIELPTRCKRFDEYMCERPKGKFVTHHYIRCDGCDKYPLVGPRYHCMECDNFDLCASCFDNSQIQHGDEHIFELIVNSVYKAKIPRDTEETCACVRRYRQLYVPGGNDPRIYDVQHLWQLTCQVPVTVVSISDARKLIGEACSRKECRSCGNMAKYDMDYPILIREVDGDLIDGTHRIRYAILMNLPHILARIVPSKLLAKSSISAV